MCPYKAVLSQQPLARILLVEIQTVLLSFNTALLSLFNCFHITLDHSFHSHIGSVWDVLKALLNIMTKSVVTPSALYV